MGKTIKILLINMGLCNNATNKTNLSQKISTIGGYQPEPKKM